MGMLDFLIDRNELPKEGMEYLYMMEMIWRVDNRESEKIEKGEIMVDVERMDNYSIQMTHKKTGTRYQTNYGWALVENTPENLIRIAAYDEANAELEIMRKKVHELRDAVVDLAELKQVK